jgi:hypothetical protein
LKNFCQSVKEGDWEAETDTPVLREYVSMLKDTVREWVAWDVGALCLMAAAAAAAVHQPVRDEFRRSGIAVSLAAFAVDKHIAGLNGEALAALCGVLVGEESSSAHIEARARVAALGVGGEEDEEEAMRREGELRAATRRPEAPPFLDADAVWKKRADDALKDISDMEEGGCDFDFGQRLQMEEIAKMAKGASSLSMFSDAIVARTDGAEGGGSGGGGGGGGRAKTAVVVEEKTGDGGEGLEALD